MFLSEMQKAERARVAFLRGTEIQKKCLANLGFRGGGEVEVIARQKDGGVVLVMGVRVAMSEKAMEAVAVSGKHPVIGR